MTAQGLAATGLMHGVIWTTLQGRVDHRVSTRVARTTLNWARSHNNHRLLVDCRRAHFAVGIHPQQLLCSAFNLQGAPATTRLALIDRAARPDPWGRLQLAITPEPATAMFRSWQRAIAWLLRPRARNDDVADTVRKHLNDYVANRLDLPRSQLRDGLSELYSLVRSLAQVRGVDALGAALARASVQNVRPPAEHVVAARTRRTARRRR
jgi:hypothetical protein